MVRLQAYSCDAVTGKTLDRIPHSSASFSRRLSAGSDGTISVPLDGSIPKAQLRNLLTPWNRLIALERDDRIEFMGYILDPPTYRRGQRRVEVQLGDLWSLIDRRGAWDHSAPHVEKWSTTVAGSLAQHAAAALIRARDTAPPLPAAGIPITIPGQTGPSVTRKVRGYHLEMIGDAWEDLMGEGLDINLSPRWIGNGDADWLFQAGVGWSSGVTREFYVTAESSDVVALSESGSGARLTNNARHVGEGSEQDMLVRSARKTDSPYILLDRVIQMKNVSDVDQLAAMSAQALVTYRDPTLSREFTVTGDSPIGIGDTVRLHVGEDEPWLPDGWLTHRVVEVSVERPGPDVKRVVVQPTGGA